MADTNDENIPPVPVPPADVAAASAVPPVESAPRISKTPAASEPAPAAPQPPAASAAPQPAAYGAPASTGGVPPAYGSPTAYGQPAYVPQPAGPAQGLSVTSLVLGIVGVMLSFLGWGFLVAVGAVVTGHLAQRRQPWARPMWLTGLITGYVGVGISLITFIVIVGFIIWGFAMSSSYY